MTGTDDPGAHDPRLMLRSALAGFDGARHRLSNATVPGAPPESIFVPLVEALWWTVSVNHAFEELADAGGIGDWPSKKDYQQARDKDPLGVFS